MTVEPFPQHPDNQQSSLIVIHLVKHTQAAPFEPQQLVSDCKIGRCQGLGIKSLDSCGQKCRTPQALINTCIRHARDNLGIDLSSCSRWMRFLEVHYQRPAATIKPPAMETPEVSNALIGQLQLLHTSSWDMSMMHNPGVAAMCRFCAGDCHLHGQCEHIV